MAGLTFPKSLPESSRSAPELPETLSRSSRIPYRDSGRDRDSGKVMRPREVLGRLRAAGVVLGVDDGALVFGPPALLTDAVIDLLETYSEALVNELVDPDPRVTCCTCANARGDRCARPASAGLTGTYIGWMKSLPQHCPAWRAASARRQAAVADQPAEPQQCGEETA